MEEVVFVGGGVEQRSDRPTDRRGLVAIQVLDLLLPMLV